VSDESVHQALAPREDESGEKDSIYIEWGRFKAGASGRVAVTFFVGLVVFGLVTKLLHWW
jgi:hypothetical protein